MNLGAFQGFVLGAGLGSRLGPLTESLPKPLLPIFGKPLVAFALDHLISAGVGDFVINTHHVQRAWDEAFPQGAYRGRALRFRHEPELLDTGGGIRNVRDLLGVAPFLVHNGDILADLDLETLITTHQISGNVVTLGLRHLGESGRVRLDVASGLVRDLRGILGSKDGLACDYTGIAVLTSPVFDFLPAEGPCSVVPAFVEMIRSGLRVGGVLLDAGEWHDVGTPGVYREIHRRIAEGLRFSHGVEDGWPVLVDPSAALGRGVTLTGWNAIGAGASIGANTRLENCIVWPGANCAAGLHLEDCIVRRTAEGSAKLHVF